MEKVKNLTVIVKYTVGLGNIDMPKIVYEQIKEAHEEGDEIDIAGKYDEALGWLTANIKENDCMDWECEIDYVS